MLRRTPVLRFAVMAVSCCPLTVQAEAFDLQTEVQGMLDAGWKVGHTAFAEAAEHYQRARGIAPGDARVRYGWTLVLLKHRRYADALQRFDAIVAKQPQHRTALMWRIRVKMLKRKFSAALADMETLAAAIPKVEADGPAEKSHVETIRFLGRMLGYLKGPAEVSANLREPAMLLIAERLTPARSVAFETARDAVVRRHAELLHQSQQTDAAARAVDQQQRDAQRAALDTERARIAMENQRISADAARIRDEQDQRLSQLDRESRRAESELARAENQLYTTVREIDFVRQQIAEYWAALDVEGDPAIRALLGARLARAETELDRWERQARRHELDAQRQARRRSELQQDASQARSSAEQDLAALANQEAELNRAVQQLLFVERKQQRPVRIRSPRAGNLATRADAFTTYEAFPLAQEKQRVLRALR